MWRDYRKTIAMRTLSQIATQSGVSAVTVQSLRDEARLLTTAGLILLALGFPLTLALAWLAMSPEGLSPILAPTAGGPLILLGYIACDFASKRLARAKALEDIR